MHTTVHCCACIASEPHDEPDCSGCEWCDATVLLTTDGQSIGLASVFWPTEIEHRFDLVGAR